MDEFYSVFDSERLPGRRLRAITTITNRYAADVGRQIEKVRYDIARQIGELCAKNEELVKIEAEGPLIELRADLIVLTEGELHDLLREQFKAGIEHANSFGHPSWIAPAADASWPEEPTDEMQAAGAGAIRFDTTVLNKIWTANAVYRAIRAVAIKGGL